MTRTLFLFLVVICMPATSSCLAEELAVGHFATEGLAGWEPKIFKGITDYRLVQENGRTVVRATSKASASGLIKKLRFDPRKFRYLRWSWKIEHPIAAGDEKSKAGDDYAARVYVVFSGRFFWQMRAINYIWANQLRKGESIPSAFTADSMMVAVESGSSLAGRWVTEERDLLADYRRLFGGEPREVNAIAIMTDTDNTGSDATAWYGEITLSTER